MRDVILTDRLHLRTVRHEDAAAIFALFNSWKVVEWLSAPAWPLAFEQTRAYLERCITEGPSVEDYRVIERDGAIIGGIGWRDRPAGPLQAEAGPNIGYWLGESFWGQGYMTEAAKALVGELFSAMSVPVIYSGLFSANIGSRRVQEKLGFAVVGEGLLHSNPRGGEFPHLNTALTRETFEKNNR